jgi:hypothetical protein
VKREGCIEHLKGINPPSRQGIVVTVSGQWDGKGPLKNTKVWGRTSGNSFVAETFAVFGLRTEEILRDGVTKAGMGLKVVLQTMNEAVLAQRGRQSLHSHQGFATASRGLGQSRQNYHSNRISGGRQDEQAILNGREVRLVRRRTEHKVSQLQPPDILTSLVALPKVTAGQAGVILTVFAYFGSAV